MPAGVGRLWAAVFVAAFGTNVPAPLLLVYRRQLDLSASVVTGAFGVYAAGLVPALLLAGPASDRFGRRPVVLPFVALSGLTSLLFVGAGWSAPVLFGCRFLQGAAAGVVFSVGTAWLGELVGEPARAARLTTAALGGGWALGPLSAGLLAQWAPAPTVLPFLVHAALTLLRLGPVPEPAPAGAPRRTGWVNLGVPPPARRAFWLVVAPVAVGVFTFPSTALTVLPLLLAPAMPQFAVAVTGLVAGLTLSAGVLAQPLGRRLGPAVGGPAGLATGAAGLALSLVAVGLQSWPVLIPVALLLGGAYGLCLTSGLTVVGALAAPTARGALTGTFYACAYAGFAAPLLLALAARDTGFAAPLAGLALLTAAVAVLLARPAARRLVTPE